jgi:competence protein ComEC
LLIFAFLLSACWVNPTPVFQPSGILEVHIIDVGQGDSILILSPDGQAGLIDGGEAGSGAYAYLRSLGINRLDWIVATHPHDDHIGGLPEVLKNIPTRKVVTNGEEHTTTSFERFIDAIAEARAEYVEAKRGDILSLGDLTIDILNPDRLDPRSLNNNSLVLRLVYGRVVFLFTGDAERGAENSMLASGLPLQSTILKAGHHGSRTSSTPDFLAKVRPSLAVYSAGQGNRYGHPHQETLDTFANLGIELMGTDLYGTIVITSDGQTYGVKGKELKEVITIALNILSITSPVAPGNTATLMAKTLPGAICEIKVFTRSGVSQAQGLEPKTAGADGIVSWTWRVGSSTAEGEFDIEVIAAHGAQTITKTVNYRVQK